MQEMIAGCPAERTLRLIEGRWKLLILSRLFAGTRRFSDLLRAVNAALPVGVSPKMLTQDLRQMEADSLVSRRVYAEVPPRVEYSLTPLGQSLRPVVESMISWGRQHEWEIEGTARPCAALWEDSWEDNAETVLI